MFQGNFLIGLREGLEAALIVSILMAYLVKTGTRRTLIPVWLGIALAIATSIGAGIALGAASAEMQFKTQNLANGALSLLTATLVTWLILWIRRPKGDRPGPFTLTTLAFLAVAREGLETVLFLRTNIDNSSEGSALPTIGAFSGLTAAIALAAALYLGLTRLDPKRFFTWIGASLVVIAAGVFAYGFHDLQEADVLPGLAATALEPGLFFTEFGAAGDWLQTLFQGVLNVTPQITWLQLLMWATYLIPVMYLFLRPVPKPS